MGRRTMTRKICIPGFRLTKDGKIIKSDKHLDASARIRQRSSKKVRVGRK
jgi:hypothetical protein